MQYCRIGPTPWVIRSQPASVSIGEPQLPICTTCQANSGTWSSRASSQTPTSGGLHVVEVLVIDARDHRVSSVDPPREERHALVLGALAGEQPHVDRLASRVLEELWEDPDAVVRRERPVVGPPAVVVGEQHQSQVFDPVPLDVREREDHDLRLEAERPLGQLEPIIRLRRRDQDVARLFQEAGGLLLFPGRLDGPRQFLARETRPKPIEDSPRRFDVDAQSRRVRAGTAAYRTRPARSP